VARIIFILFRVRSLAGSGAYVCGARRDAGAWRGLYGVIAFNAQQRAQEFAVRVALGASPRHILQALGGPCLRTMLSGLALGTPIALAAGRLVAPLLFETSATDPVIIVSSGALIVVVSIAATLVPTTRVLSRRPADVLRGN